MGFESKTGGNVVLIPTGNHVARCYMVVDLGHHHEEFQGKDVGDRKKVRIGFEFPTKKHVFNPDKGEEPFTLSIKLTNSMHEKGKLRPMMEAWRGKPYNEETLSKFRIDKIIGQPALVTVSHKPRNDGSGSIAKIVTVAPLVEGMICPPAVLPTVLYTVDWGRNHEVFGKLPKWLQEECSQCLEWKPKTGEQESEVANGAPEGNTSGEEGESPF